MITNSNEDVFEWLPEHESRGASDLDVPWRLLIADDDVDVHAATRFALRNLKFKGRPVAFVDAYSGVETLEILQNQTDIALVLLDVVMESPNAGLLVAQTIRQQYWNCPLRVILRTGQAGLYRDYDVAQKYEVDGILTKGDLTTNKLIVTVICALRNYVQLAEARRCSCNRDTQISTSIS